MALVTFAVTNGKGILESHTAVPHPRPGFVKHRQEGLPLTLLFWMTYRGMYYEDQKELVNFLADQRDEITGISLFDISCVVTSGNKDMVEKENLLTIPLVIDQLESSPKSLKDFYVFDQDFISEEESDIRTLLKSEKYDLAVLDSEYEASDLMEYLDVSYLLLQGFKASELMLPHESPTYRHTLNCDSSYLTQYFDSESVVTRTYESLSDKFAEVYSSLMIQEDKKFATKRDGKALSPEDKTASLQGMLEQVEYFSKFGTKHLKPVVKDVAIWARHDFEIKFVLAQ